MQQECKYDYMKGTRPMYARYHKQRSEELTRKELREEETLCRKLQRVSFNSISQNSSQRIPERLIDAVIESDPEDDDFVPELIEEEEDDEDNEGDEEEETDTTSESSSSEEDEATPYIPYSHVENSTLSS
jgi:hypothetical protein